MNISYSHRLTVVRSEALTRAEDFERNRLVGVSYGLAGTDLSRFAAIDEDDSAWEAAWAELKALLKEVASTDPRHRGKNLDRVVTSLGAALWHFLVIVKPQRIVLSPVLGGMRVGRVSGRYFYRPDQEPYHCVPVRWLGVLPDADLPAEIRSRLRNQAACFSFEPGSLGHRELVDALARIPEQGAPEAALDRIKLDEAMGLLRRAQALLAELAA
jgi:predicted Mrr-cat superfamily restriction endonuclease